MSKPSVKVVDVFTSVRGYNCTVVEYIDANNVVVLFDTGHTKRVSAGNLRKGEFKNLMHPEVCGVGCFGEGPHKGSIGGRDTFEYSKWLHMIRRCYGGDQIVSAATYAGCSGCDEWLNLRKFGEWVKGQVGYGLRGWHLDKGLLEPGNRVYCPDKCVLVPPYLNAFFSKPSKRSDLPMGV